MNFRKLPLSLLSSLCLFLPLHLSLIILLPFLIQLTPHHRHQLLSFPALSLSSTDSLAFLFKLPPLFSLPPLCHSHFLGPRQWLMLRILMKMGKKQRHPKHGPSVQIALILSEIVPWWSSWQFCLSPTHPQISCSSFWQWFCLSFMRAMTMIHFHILWKDSSLQ